MTPLGEGGFPPLAVQMTRCTWGFAVKTLQPADPLKHVLLVWRLPEYRPYPLSGWGLNKLMVLQKLRTIRGLLKDTVSAWIDDQASSMGAALAFYTVLSMAPPLILSLVLSTALAALGKYWSGLIPQLQEVLQGLDFVVSFGLSALLFALLYKLLSASKLNGATSGLGRPRPLCCFP